MNTANSCWRNTFSNVQPCEGGTLDNDLCYENWGVTIFVFEMVADTHANVLQPARDKSINPSLFAIQSPMPKSRKEFYISS